MGGNWVRISKPGETYKVMLPKLSSAVNQRSNCRHKRLLESTTKVTGRGRTWECFQLKLRKTCGTNAVQPSVSFSHWKEDSNGTPT